MKLIYIGSTESVLIAVTFILHRLLVPDSALNNNAQSILFIFAFSRSSIFVWKQSCEVWRSHILTLYANVSSRSRRYSQSKCKISILLNWWKFKWMFQSNIRHLRAGLCEWVGWCRQNCRYALAWRDDAW